MAVAEFVEHNRIRIAGLLGVLGMGLGVLADLASGYSLQGAADVTTAFSVLSLETLSVFLVSKPTTEVILGHYLAILGIPLGLFGLWQVYRGIEPAGRWLARGAWFLGVFGYVVGTLFHGTFAFVTFGVQAADSAPSAAEQTMWTMLERFALAFEPLALILVILMTVGFGLIFVAIAFRETYYPRWFAFANPLIFQAVTGGVALLGPVELRVFLVVTAYNLSLVVFYALSTALLWNGELHRQATVRSDSA